MNLNLLIFILIVINVLSGQSILESTSPAETIQDYNIYIKNWGFELGGEFWDDDISDLITYNQASSYHLFSSLVFGLNRYNNNTIQQVSQNVYIPKLNDSSSEQLKFEFSILLPTTTTNIQEEEEEEEWLTSSSSTSPTTSISFINLTIQLDNIILFQFNLSEYWIDNPPNEDNDISNYLTISIDLDNGIFGSNSGYHKLLLLAGIDPPSSEIKQQSYKIQLDNIQIYKLPNQLINSNLYVSMQGSDGIDGNGTELTPFRTIQKAIDLINTTTGYNDIIITSNDYLFQSDETIFNRGKKINLIGSDGSNIIIGTTPDYTGFFFVSTSPICNINNSITNTTEIILNCQNYLINNIQDQMNNIQFTMVDIEISSDQIENTNSTFSATQFSNIKIENLKLSTTNQGVPIFFGCKGSIFSILNSNITSIYQFGFSTLIIMESNQLIMDSIEFITSSTTLTTSNSNVTITNTNYNGLLNHIGSLVPYQQIYYENITITNITDTGNYIFSFVGLFHVPANEDLGEVITFNNIHIHGCDTIEFFQSLINGKLIIDGLSIVGTLDIKTFLIIANRFYISNVYLYSNYFESTVSQVHSISMIAEGIGYFNNIYIDKMNGNIEAALFYVNSEFISFDNVTYTDSNINFINSNSSNIYISNFKCDSVVSGSIFANGESSYLQIDNLQYTNNQIGMLIDMSFNVVINNSIFSNNTIISTQQYSVPLVSSSFTMYLENTVFSNNQGLALISAINCGVTLINVTFDNNVHGVGIVASAGTFYGNNLHIINSSSKGTNYPGFVTLLSNINITLINSQFAGVSFPLSISFCDSVEMDNVNFYNSTGSSNIILLYGIFGNWSNSIIYGSASSLLASPFSFGYSSMNFQSVEFSFSSSSNYPFGIYISNESPYLNIQFLNCTFKNSMDVVAGGMSLSYFNSVSFISCKFQDNTNNNAIIVASFVNQLSFVDCTFSSNTALNTSSIAMNNCTFSIVDTVFSDNSLSSTINITFSQGSFNGCTFKDNSSPNSIIVSRDSKYSFNNSNIVNSNSKAYSKFSYIADSGSNLLFENSVIQNSLTFNIPTCFLNNSKLVVVGSTFTNNTNIGGSGGVFFLTNCNATFVNVNFQSNYAHIGGSIYSQFSNLSIVNSSFQNNNATVGGSLFYFSTNSNVTNTNFTENSAQVGFYSNFQNSTLNSNGGSIYISNVYLNFNNLVVNSGSLSNGGSGNGSGGKLKDQQTADISSFKSSNISIDSSTFISNIATMNGGCIFNDDVNSNITINSTTFIGNMAQQSGGGIMYTHCPFTTLNLEYSNNSALYGNEFASNLTVLKFTILQEIQVLTPFVVYITGEDFYGNFVILENSQYSAQLQVNITLPNGTLISTIDQSGYYGDTDPEFSILNDDADVVVGSVFSFYTFIYSSDINSPIVSSYYNLTVVGCFKNSQYLENNICVDCPPGTLGYDGIHCFNCNENLYCPGGSVGTWETGYWFNDSLSDFKTYPCNPVLCLQHTCRLNHNGTLCGECVGKTSKSMSFCQPCYVDGSIDTIFAIIFPIALALLMIFIMIFQMPNRSILYPVFSNIQIISMLAQFSETYTFFQIFNARIDFITSQCIFYGVNFYDKFYFGICTITFLILSTCILKCTKLVLFFEKFKIKSTSPSTSSSSSSFGIVKNRNCPTRFFNILVSTSLLFFIPVVLFSFQILSCIKVDGVYYLLYDTQLQCYDSDHFNAIIVSSICLFYYLLIFIYLSIHLIRNQSLNWLKSYFSISKYFKKKSSFVSFTINNNEYESKFNYKEQPKKDLKIKQQSQSIYFNQFKFETQYWQVLQMLCYLPIIYSSTFTIAYSPVGQLLSLSFTTFQFFILVIQPPFKTTSRNVIEIIFVLILFVAAVFNNSRLITTTQLSGYLFLSCSTSIMLLSILYTFKKFKNYLKNK